MSQDIFSYGFTIRPAHSRPDDRARLKSHVLGFAIVLVITGCSYNVAFDDCQVTCQSSDECPGDLTCTANLCRVGGATGACSAPGTITVRQAMDDKVDRNLVVGCTNPDGTTPNESWFRLFSLAQSGVSGTFHVEHVTIGVCFAVGMPDVQLKLSTYGGGLNDTMLDVSKVTALAQNTVAIPPTQITELVQAPITTDVPAGSLLLVEVGVIDLNGTGEQFNMGMTAASETKPGYLKSPLCGPTAPTTTTAAGLPNAHVVLTVTGSQ